MNAPHSPEAEESILGAVLLAEDSETKRAIVDRLHPNDFYITAHQSIVEAMRRLCDAGKPIDHTTLEAELQRGGEWAKVGGVSKLSHLLDVVPGVENVDHYIDIVHDRARRRKLIGIAEKVAREAAGDGDVSALADRLAEAAGPNQPTPLQLALAAGARQEWTAGSIRFVFDFVTVSSRTVQAWVEIHHRDRLLTYGQYNLMGARTVSTLARDVPDTFQPLIRDVVYRVVQAELVGEEPVVLADVNGDRPGFVLRPILEAGGNTRIIAAGGSAKSLFALATELTVVTGRSGFLGLRPQVTGPALYLDWEADAHTHAERSRALCRAVGIPVPKELLYVACKQPLYRLAHRIARSVAEMGAVMIVIDSNAMARGEADGAGVAAEGTTTRLMGALREIGVPALIVDHKSDEKARKGILGGYGSIFNQNLVRREWEITRRNEIGNALEIVLTDAKRNNTRRYPDMAFRFTFQNDGEGDDEHLSSLAIRQIAADDVKALTLDSDASKEEKVVQWLRHQDSPRTYEQIEHGTGISQNTLRTIFSRTNRFEEVGNHKPKLWRLAGEPRDEGTQAELPDPFPAGIR